MIKGFKVRLYPTKEQEELIWKHIHACRFMWNYMLELQESRYKNGESHLSAFGMNYLITPLKKEPDKEWLKEVSTASLKLECGDVANAYQGFFKSGKWHPKFKSRRKAKPAYPVRCDSVWFSQDLVAIEKVGKVRFRSDRSFPQGRGHKFSNVRLSFINGKYILSFGMECENQTPILNGFSMGIDLGIKELAVVACGDKQMVFHNINKSRKMRDLDKRIKHAQRSVSRKYEAAKKRTGRYEKSRNIEREENNLRNLHARKANIRQNYLHQTTHALVSELPKTVVMEDLNVSGMMKNRHLSKAVSEQGFYEFIRQMKYKCEWNGIEFIQVDRFYPSSKTCSHCGNVKRDLKLSDRTYACPVCGLTIDRDYNAAINLMRYAVLHTQVAA